MPTPTNVALGKPATASSFIQPFTASRACDGSTGPTNRWVSQVPQYGAVPGTVATLTIDLGPTYPVISSYTMQHMAFAGWPAGYANQNFTVSSSMDGAVWTQVDSVVNNTSAQNSKAFSAIPSRYVMFVFTKGMSKNPGVISVCDIQVNGVPNTYLQLLTVNGAQLAAPFNPTNTSMTATAGPDTATVTLVPIAYNPSLPITINGTVVPNGGTSQPISLNYGDNTITIVVGPQGSGTTYTLNVKRACNQLSNLTLSDGTNSIPMNQAFDSNTTVYSANLRYEISQLSATATAVVPGQETLTINTVSAQSGVAVPVALPTAGGTGTVTASATGTSGAAKTYTINLTRASNPFLTGIVIAGAATQPVLNQSLTNYTYPTTMSKVKVTPTAETGASISVTDANNVNYSITAANPQTPAIPSSGFTVTVTSAVGGQTVVYHFTKQ